MKCQVDAIQWGRGGSSRIFPWSPQAVAIQWGGGVVAEFFRGLRPKTGAISVQWGRGSTIHFPLMGPFYMNRPLYSYIQQNGRSIKSMNAKYTKKITDS